MNVYDVVKRPVITEQSMSQMDQKKYTFDVDVRATKTQVKNAVEQIFDVKVSKVNILNVRGKKKRMGRYVGFTNKRRKAVVTLTEASKDIELFASDGE